MSTYVLRIVATQGSQNPTEEDGVSPLRVTYLSLTLASAHHFSWSQQTFLSDLFQKAHLTFQLLEPPSAYHLPLKELYVVARLLSCDVEHLPYFVWRALVQISERPRLSLTQVGEKIGADLWHTLHPYQKVGVRFLVERKRAYIGDEMGTGKTLQSLMACQYYKEAWPVLIICPSSLRYTWKAEIMNWLHVAEPDIYVLKAAQDVKKIVTPSFLILSYSLLPKPQVLQWLAVKKYQVLVFDECHYTKSITSKRAQAASYLSTFATYCFLLSGTPFSYPVEMYQQLKLLNPELYPWFFNYSGKGAEEPHKYYYAQRYCKPKLLHFHGKDQWMFKGYDQKEELQAVLYNYMIRRKKQDILTQLPAKTRICITLEPLARKQEKEIAALLEEEKADQKNQKKQKTQKKHQPEAEAQREDQEEPPLLSEAKVHVPQSGQEKYMKSFRLTNQYKIPQVLSFLKEHLVGEGTKEETKDESKKTLLFMHHDVMREALETFLQDHKLSYFLINGATSALKRAEYVKAFQTTNQYTIALLSLTAAGVGLTLTAAQTVIFTEILFGPELHLQAEDRAHRLGQKNEVNIFYLIQPKTTDDINFGLLRKKERESSSLLDAQTSYLPAQRTTQAEWQDRQREESKDKRKIEPVSTEIKKVKRPKKREEVSMSLDTTQMYHLF